MAQREEIRAALGSWGQDIQMMLNQRFGKGKVGYFLAIFPFGGQAQVSWRSSANVDSVIQMMDGLSKHLKEDKTAIQKPTDDEIINFS